MHRRVRIPGLTALALLVMMSAVLLLASGPSRASAARCGSAAGHTLAADLVVRVYVLGDVVYGCARGGARTYKLGQRRTCVGASRVGPVKVAGRLAAYGLAQCGVDTGFTDVIVRRLSDGVQLHAFSATSPPGPESYQQVDSLALKADGAVAWIGAGSSILGGSKLVEVYKGERDGDKLLDSGAAVSPRSLRLHRSTLSWKHGGATRMATLH